MAKILVIDDDLELQDLAKFTFESAGYEVYQLYDAKGVLDKIKQIVPDIVIVDVMMPEISGFEVVSELRKDPETCLLPIIMLTSLSQTKDKLTGLKLGVDEYLVKPIEPYELVTRVENLLKKYYDNVNLLTKLPAENIFEKQIINLINSSEEFNLIYFDIINFKPYNLKYGFQNGDNLLKLFSGIIRSTITNLGTKKDSFYHIHASRFAVISYIEEGIGTIIENIMILFKDLVKKIFDKETIDKGYFTYLLSDGTEEKSNLINLAVAVAKVSKGRFTHHGELLTYINELLNLAKEKCRKTSNNIVVWG